MSLSERSSASYPDELTPDTQRRLQLWRAIADLSRAQEDGRLTADQARLLESLADNLQRLSEQLSALAALGRQVVEAVEPLAQTSTAHPHDHDSTAR